MPRKLLIVFAALLLASLIIVFATPLGLPSEDDFDVVCKGETELCAATNNAIESYVYEIVDGKINRIYKWFNLEDRRINPIVALAQSENNIYAVCEYSNEWQIRSMVRTDPVPFAILGRKEGETVLNYTVNQGVGHITVRTADGGIKVLENNKDTPNDWKTKLAAKAPSAGEVVEAHYVGEILNLKYSDGQAVSVTSSGVSALTDQTVFEKPALDTLKFSLSARLACKQTILLIIVIGLGIVFIPILLAMSVINKTKRIQTRLSAAFIALFFVAGCVFCGVVCLDAILGASVAALPLMLLKVAIALIVFSGIGAIVVILLMRHSTEPMKDLTKRMSLIADGDFTVQDVPQREDELGEMYRNLQQMCL
ncbi:MAG: HAMP domain-containing protein, partial [Oscillospiraceae bacterium]